jgi:NitT/TauT family transport system substrate-binding protein
MTSRLSALILGVGLGVGLVVPTVQAQTPVKFNLGWRIEGSGAGYLVAAEKGYYKEAGLSVTIDTGNGSSGAITAVAGGAYQAASADLVSMIQHNIKTPPEGRLIAAAIQYDTNPNAIFVRKSSGITTPKQLIGKKIAGQPANASRALFPIFAKAQGLPPDALDWQAVDPGLGIQLFMKGEFDGVAFFISSFTGNLTAPEDFTQFRFSDYGLQSYGNGIVVDPKFAVTNPKAMAGFIKASVRGWLDVIADPAVGAKAVKAREPLADEALELKRLTLIVNATMKTDDTKANGWGAATKPRLQASIEETLFAFNLTGNLTPDDVFTDKFLPPAAERKLR